MAINSNSFTTATNIQFGSIEMKDMWWNAQTFLLPEITLAPPQINNRSGAMINLGSDTVTYGELSIRILLDKEWRVYDSLYSHFIKRLNVEDGTFVKEGTFDLWVQMFDGKGKPVKKFDFFKARLTSFGQIDFDSSDPEDTQNVLEISFVFDYMNYDNIFDKIRTQKFDTSID